MCLEELISRLHVLPPQRQHLQNGDILLKLNIMTAVAEWSFVKLFSWYCKNGFYTLKERQYLTLFFLIVYPVAFYFNAGEGNGYNGGEVLPLCIAGP